MRVQVTQEDIDKGVDCDSGRCPIARALLRQVPGVVSVCVTVDGVDYAKADGRFAAVELPREAVRFITLFDDGRLVSPFEFDLNLRPEGRE